LAATSAGDARQALNSLQSSSRRDARSEPDRLDAAKLILQRRSLMYDKSGEQHYTSFPRFTSRSATATPTPRSTGWCACWKAAKTRSTIARRLVRAASEDVGNADPQALIFAMAVKERCNFVACRRRPGAGAARRLSRSRSESNAHNVGYGQAVHEVRQATILRFRLHIRNCPHALMKDIGYGAATNPRTTTRSDRGMECLPDSLAAGGSTSRRTWERRKRSGAAGEDAPFKAESRRQRQK